MNIACHLHSEAKKKNKKYEHQDQVISLRKHRTKRLNKSRIVMTNSFLSEIIEPNDYTTPSSIDTCILTYIKPKNQ